MSVRIGQKRQSDKSTPSEIIFCFLLEVNISVENQEADLLLSFQLIDQIITGSATEGFL